MEQLNVISHSEFGKIRTEMVKNEPWFSTQDVCRALDIEYYRDAASRLDADERGSLVVDTLGGNQSISAVNESGLYSLIFQSRKPEAVKFRKWVTSEVLPSIRKTGEYRVKCEAPELEWYNNELCVRGGWLIESGVMSDSNYRAMINRGILTRERRSCQNRPALVRWESLPERFKNKVRAVHGPIAPPRLAMDKDTLARVMADVCLIEDRELRIRLMKHLYQ